MTEQSPEEIISLRASSITQDLLTLTEDINPLAREAAKYIFESGGSRGRGVVFELQHELLGGPKEFRREGALVKEVGHGVSLIDNDFLDEQYVSEKEVDGLRRGRLPTHRARGFPETMAAASTLQQLGTYLLAKTAHQHGKTPEEIVEMQEDLYHTIDTMWNAQLLDVMGKDNKTPRDLEYVLINKNGIWSYAHRTAAKLAGQNKSIESRLASLGKKVDRAHQGRDDIHDFILDRERGSWAHFIGLDAAYAELGELQTEILTSLDSLAKEIKKADLLHYEQVQYVVPLLAHLYTSISTPKISLEEMKEKVARSSKQ